MNFDKAILIALGIAILAFIAKLIITGSLSSAQYVILGADIILFGLYFTMWRNRG